MGRSTTAGCWLALCSLFAILLPAAAAAQRAADDVHAALARDGEVRVLVALRGGAGPETTAAERRESAAAVQQRVLRRTSASQVRVAHRYQGIAAFAGVVDAGGLAALLADPDVVRVVLDAGGSGSLAESVPLIQADVLHNTYGFTGAGATVAVIDTGFDSDHPDLAGALAGEQCFCSTGGGCCPNGQATQSGPGSAEDDHSHGTHVSGIITSDGNVASVGVAPDAQIVAVKVMDSNNTFCCISDVIAGLDWVANNRPDVKAVNMSLGTGVTYGGDCDALDFNPFVAAAVNNLTANGVAVFAATHNYGLSNAITSPACIANAIAVGATDDADAVASFSNSSPSVDLLGPGVGIVSSVASGGALSFSGTSMATPHAAGVAALLLDANPFLSGAEIEAALEAGGVPVADPRNALVRPRVDALGALLSLTCGNGALDPGEVCDDGDLESGDGCDVNCTPTGCGNGVTTAGEACDSGAGNGSDGCCTVACALIDEDGDGTCSRDDACPHVAAASPTTLIPPDVILVYKNTGPGGGDDRPKVLRADFNTPVSFDPDSTHAVHLRLRNTRTGGTLFAASLAAGGFWRQPNPTKLKWIWVDPANPTSTGVKRGLLKQLFADTQIYRFKLVGRDADISVADAPLVPATDDVEVLLEIEAAGSGLCLASTVTDCENTSPSRDRCR